VRNLLRLARETGDVKPRPHGAGHRLTLDLQAMRVVVRFVRSTPDATLDELREQVCEKTGHHVSRSTMCRAVRRTGWRRKKNIPRLKPMLLCVTFSFFSPRPCRITRPRCDGLRSPGQ
jgi:transposase